MGTLSQIKIGTCGFSYQDWRKVFYPEKLSDKEFLAYYAEHFQALELNMTFYRLPSLKIMASMASRTPQNFSFIIKAYKDITHVRGDAGFEAMPLFREMLKPIADAGKLGGILLQFPYSFKPSGESADYLEKIGRMLKGTPGIVEFRHKSWFTPDQLHWLKHLGLSLCCVDEPELPNLPPRVAEVTGPIGYVRFHGRNKETWWSKDKPTEEQKTFKIPLKQGHGEERYRYSYKKDELREWVPKLESIANTTGTTFAFFNNHPDGNAVKNAQTLIELVQS